MATNELAALEAAITALTQPLNGQYPRPWMTDLANPMATQVMIIGRNQKKQYDATRLTHERHLNALFNRNGESCRALYTELGGTSSITRQNTDRLRGLLQPHGVQEVLETNVICYSSDMSADLRLPEHQGGRVKGTEIFRTLLQYVQPPVMIAHGAKTIKNLSTILGCALPSAPQTPGKPVSIKHNNTTIFLVRSLAPREWWKWHTWADSHLDLVAQEVAALLAEPSMDRKRSGL